MLQVTGPLLIAGRLRCCDATQNGNTDWVSENHQPDVRSSGPIGFDAIGILAGESCSRDTAFESVVIEILLDGSHAVRRDRRADGAVRQRRVYNSEFQAWMRQKKACQRCQFFATEPRQGAKFALEEVLRKVDSHTTLALTGWKTANLVGQPLPKVRPPERFQAGIPLQFVVLTAFTLLLPACALFRE